MSETKCIELFSKHWLNAFHVPRTVDRAPNKLAFTKHTI